MTSLQAHLETYSKEELRHYARSLGLSLSRSLKKADLAQAIAGELLREDTLRRRMGILTDEQIRLFERAAAEPCRPGETEMGDALRLHDLDYGIYSERDGLLRIPEDVALSYKKLSCRAFHHYRRRVAWLMKCLYFAEILFGVTPVDHLYGMYMDHPCFKVSRERFMYYLVQIPSDLRDCFVSDQYLVSGAWYEIGECRRLLSEQVGRDYYSPSWEEVDELWRENCLTGGDAWKALEEWLRTSEGMGEKLCGDVTCELWNRLAGGTPFDEAALWLAEQLSFMEDEKIQTMMKLLREAAGETRMLFNRGFCWNEIGDKEDASSLACQVLIMPGSSDAVRRVGRLEKSLRDKGFLPYYGIRAEYLKELGRTVYPADPCPCGSGRSYIRCCGRDWTEKHRL